MITEMKLQHSIIGHRYSLIELEETLEAFEGGNVELELVDTTDKDRYIDGEDYKINIKTKEGTGTLWYALTRDMRKLIIDVEFSIVY